MNRSDILLASLSKTSKTLEFGALDRPLIEKRNYSVKYVDFTSRDQLALKLKEVRIIDCEKLVEVDIIWNGNASFCGLDDHRPVDSSLPLMFLSTFQIRSDGCTPCKPFSLHMGESA